MDYEFDPIFPIENHARHNSFARRGPEHILPRPFSYAQTESEYYSYEDDLAAMDPEHTLLHSDLPHEYHAEDHFAMMDAEHAVSHAYREEYRATHLCELAAQHDEYYCMNIGPEHQLAHLDQQDQLTPEARFAKSKRQVPDVDIAGNEDDDAPISAAARIIHIRETRAKLVGHVEAERASLRERVQSGVARFPGLRGRLQGNSRA